jgi:hypothetical protein
MNANFFCLVGGPQFQFRLLRFGTLCLFLLADLLTCRAEGQAPNLVWTANVGGSIFAVDDQTNVYVNVGTNVIKLGGNGLPVQTNGVCPVPSLSPGYARLDAAGNYYFAGTFDGTNDFGGVTLAGGWIHGSPSHWSPGFPTCFLAKYSSNRVLQWAVSFGVQGATVSRVGDFAFNADGSITVSWWAEGFAAYLSRYSASGTNLWNDSVSAYITDAMKVSGFSSAHNGVYVKYEYPFIVGGFYDALGNVTNFDSPLFFSSRNLTSLNPKPVIDDQGIAYLAGKSGTAPFPPILTAFLPNGSLAWTQSIGSVEQWILAGDSGGNLYLAATNGLFSKYYKDGTLIWSTNYGASVITMLVDSQGNRFLQFIDNSIARLASDPLPVAPTIPIPPQSQTVFVGSNVTLTASISGTPPLRYAWRQNGTNVPNATNAVLNLVSVTPSQAGAYMLVVTNIAGAVTSTPSALLRVKSVELYLGSQLLTNGTYVFASPPTLTIRSAFAGGSSFYTLDGSAPSFSGTYYTGPFSLTQSATVRAIGYSSDFFQSEEADTVNAIVLVNHTLSVSSSGGGSVTLNPPGGTYVSTNVVTATAVPSAGNSFLYWLGDAAGTSPSVNISMERDKSIRAVFGTSLSTTVSGSGQIQLFPAGGLYPYGSVVRLTAIPDAGNYFGFWGSAATGNTNPLYFTIAAPTQTVSSIFGATPGGQAALTVLISGDGRVNASPRANAYTLNQNVNLTAVPDSGQSFLGWSGDAGGVQNPLSVTMSAAKVITASFTARPTLRVDRTGLEGQSPEGFRLTLVSDPGNVFQIFGSTDLAVWIGLGAVSNSYGEVQFTDTNSPSFPRRFYKAAP